MNDAMVSDCCGADYTMGEGWFGEQIGIIYVCKKCRYRCTLVKASEAEHRSSDKNSVE